MMWASDLNQKFTHDNYINKYSVLFIKLLNLLTTNQEISVSHCLAFIADEIQVLSQFDRLNAPISHNELWQ